MPTKKQEARNQEPTFESAIARMETIVEEMESDKLPLEDLLVRYEEGIKLVKFCSEKLEAAEKRIEIITREAGGKTKLSEFDADQKQAANTGSDAALF
jgi:exodeoxyribonuclease VII small subunit